MLPEGDRVRMALAGGADLVIGLPLPWSLASAEGFAFGMVSALDALGCVDIISFGSESGDIAALQKAADCLSTDRFAQLLRYHLDYGINPSRKRGSAPYRKSPVTGQPNCFPPPTTPWASNTLRRCIGWIRRLCPTPSPVSERGTTRRTRSATPASGQLYPHPRAGRPAGAAAPFLHAASMETSAPRRRRELPAVSACSTGGAGNLRR